MCVMTDGRCRGGQAVRGRGEAQQGQDKKNTKKKKNYGEDGGGSGADVHHRGNNNNKNTNIIQQQQYEWDYEQPEPVLPLGCFGAIRNSEIHGKKLNSASNHIYDTTSSNYDHV